MGNGLLVELVDQHPPIPLEGFEEALVWSVLWSVDGKVVRHRGYELRLVEALAVAEYKARAAKIKKRSANL
jgi:hypothetical protein